MAKAITSSGANKFGGQFNATDWFVWNQFAIDLNKIVAFERTGQDTLKVYDVGGNELCAVLDLPKAAQSLLLESLSLLGVKTIKPPQG